MRRIVPFLITLSLVLFGGHLAVYEMLRAAWPSLTIVSITPRIVVIVIFALSFNMASLWVHESDSFLAQSFYKLTVWWMSFFLNLLVATVLWVTLGHAEVWSIVAIVVTFYALFHARRIVHKTYTVTLPNLGMAWQEKRVVMLSDLHLGAVNGEKYAERIVQEIEKLAPDIVFICGDFFDGVKADEEKMADVFAKLHPRDGIYFVTGNHEEFSDSTSKERALEKAGIHILNNKKVEVDGVQIIGVDYKSTRSHDDFKKVLNTLNINPTQPSILLRHVPDHLDVARDAHVSLLLTGHTHNGQQVPANFLAAWTHKGFGYGLRSLGTLQVLVTSGIGTWGPPVRGGTDSELLSLILK